MRSALVLAVLVSFCAFGAAEIPPGLTPVAAAQLDGVRVKLPNDLGSVAAPGADWKWYAMASGASQAYMCIHNDSGATFSVIVNDKMGELSLDAAKQILNGAKKGAERRGMTVTDDEASAADFPVAGKSFRILYTVNAPNKKLRAYQHLVSVGKSVLIFQTQVIDNSEPTEFIAFIKTYKAAK